MVISLLGQEGNAKAELEVSLSLVQKATEFPASV